MAIQTVGIGAAPNDNTGDTPRTGISKLNANFTDTTNAASRLVQTSPSDATAGRVLTTDSTHTAAGVLYTGANFEPQLRGGINTRGVFFMVSGTATVDATVSGSLLYYAKLNASGQYIPSVNSPTGTAFKNLGVQSCSTTVPCTFVRQS